MRRLVWLLAVLEACRSLVRFSGRRVKWSLTPDAAARESLSCKGDLHTAYDVAPKACSKRGYLTNTVSNGQPRSCSASHEGIVEERRRERSLFSKLEYSDNLQLHWDNRQMVGPCSSIQANKCTMGTCIEDNGCGLSQWKLLRCAFYLGTRRKLPA